MPTPLQASAPATSPTSPWRSGRHRPNAPTATRMVRTVTKPTRSIVVEPGDHAAVDLLVQGRDPHERQGGDHEDRGVDRADAARPLRRRRQERDADGGQQQRQRVAGGGDLVVGCWRRVVAANVTHTAEPQAPTAVPVAMVIQAARRRPVWRRAPRNNRTMPAVWSVMFATLVTSSTFQGVIVDPRAPAGPATSTAPPRRRRRPRRRWWSTTVAARGPAPAQARPAHLGPTSDRPPRPIGPGMGALNVCRSKEGAARHRSDGSSDAAADWSRCRRSRGERARGPDLERLRGGLPGRRAQLARGARADPGAALGRHRRGLRPAPGVGARPARRPLGRRVVARGLRRPRRLAVGVADLRGGVLPGRWPPAGHPERHLPARPDHLRVRHARPAGPLPAPDVGRGRPVVPGLVRAQRRVRPGRRALQGDP